jgi:hypothetical protein
VTSFKAPVVASAEAKAAETPRQRRASPPTPGPVPLSPGVVGAPAGTPLFPPESSLLHRAALAATPLSRAPARTTPTSGPSSLAAPYTLRRPPHTALGDGAPSGEALGYTTARGTWLATSNPLVALHEAVHREQFARGEAQRGPPYAPRQQLEAEARDTSQRRQAGILAPSTLAAAPNLRLSFTGDVVPLSSKLLGGDPILEQINQDDHHMLSVRGWMHRGDHVRKIQEALLQLGYELPEFGADGHYGDETANAVRAFQRDNGLGAEDGGQAGAGIDGILGAQTLRRLDLRVDVDSQLRPPTASGVRATHLLFEVPVTAEMVSWTSAQFLHHSLSYAFGITTAEAARLDELGWRFTSSGTDTEIEVVPDDRDVERGHRTLFMPRDDYEGVRGRIRADLNRPDGPSAQAQVEASYFDIQGTEELHTLTQQIEDKLRQLAGYRLAASLASGELDDFVQRTEAELDDLIARRNALLSRHGFTVESWEQAQQQFIDTFERFAATVALELLADNETRARMEANRYDSPQQVEALQAALLQVAPHWTAADTHFWQGISSEYTPNHDPDLVRSSSDLAEYVHGSPLSDYDEYDRADDIVRFSQRWRTERHASNTYFQQTYDAEVQAVEALAARAQQFPILAYPELNLRRHLTEFTSGGTSALLSAVRDAIGGPGEGVLGSIAATRERLASEPGKIWSLPPVIAAAQRRLGIREGSVHATVIREEQQRREDNAFWTDLGLAALGIGLGLAALASGPVGWFALAGSIGVGLVDLSIQYDRIATARDAHNAAIDPQDALSTVAPSWFWFGVSLVSLGLDVGAAAKLLGLFPELSRAARTGEELTELTQDAIDQTRRALTSELAGAVGDNATTIARSLDDLDDTEALVRSAAFAQRAGLLARVSADPAAMARLASALDSDDLVAALVRLERAADPDLFATVLHNLAAPNAHFVTQFHEVVRASEVGRYAELSQDLYREVLSNPHVQRVVLDHIDEPTTINRLWREWQGYAARPAGSTANLPFHRYLASRGFATSLERTSESLVARFGAVFDTLGPLARNRQVLRTTESRLLDAFDAGNQLPPRVQQALGELLNEDLIGSAATVEAARQRIVSRMNSVLAQHMDGVDDYQRVLDLISQPASRGSIGEQFAAALDLIPGLRSARRAVIDLTHTTIPALQGRSRIIIDRFINGDDILAEIKVGSSFDEAQLDLYKAVYDNQVQLESTLRAAGIESGSIDRVIYQVLPGPSNATTVVEPATHAQRIWDAMVTKGMSRYGEVRYLARDGTRWSISIDGAVRLP